MLEEVVSLMYASFQTVGPDHLENMGGDPWLQISSPFWLPLFWVIFYWLLTVITHWNNQLMMEQHKIIWSVIFIKVSTVVLCDCDTVSYLAAFDIVIHQIFL